MSWVQDKPKGVMLVGVMNGMPQEGCLLSDSLWSLQNSKQLVHRSQLRVPLAPIHRL